MRTFHQHLITHSQSRQERKISMKEEKKKHSKWLFRVIPLFISFVVLVLCYQYQNKHHNVFEEAKHLEVQNQIEKGDQVVVYYGSEICSSCVEFAPILKNIMDEADIKVAYINADNSENKSFVKLHHFEKTPSLVIFKDGKEAERYTDDMIYDGMAKVLNEKMESKEAK